MSRVFVRGFGAVSPAGWGLEALRLAVTDQRAMPLKELPRPGWDRSLLVRPVPPLSSRPAWSGHPRLRRSSPISQYAVAAAMEALGGQPREPKEDSLGVVLCVMSGCVNYSRRFFDEVLRDPGTASPLVFPETVFNAPSSHLAALLASTALNYTLVGDPGTFLVGLALAAEWLSANLVDHCLVVGAEELDWLTADAFRLFSREMVVCEGAGALLLSREAAGARVELTAITDAHLFFNRAGRRAAACEVARQLAGTGPLCLLCDGLQGVRSLDEAETEAWSDRALVRLSPKRVLGEGLMAAAAWQCVLAAESLHRGAHPEACVSVVGCNEQAIGCRFAATPAQSVAGE